MTNAQSPTHLFSASQVSLYRECPRKWAWQYIAWVERQSTPGQELGTDVDDNQLQPYLKDAKPFDLTRKSGLIAKSLLDQRYLPDPRSPGLEVQKHFVIPSATARNPDGSALFGFQGYLDLWLPDAMYMPQLPAGCEGKPCVGDFKTTKNLRYAKTPKQLETDVQAQLYATWALYLTRASYVELVWLYMCTEESADGSYKTKRSYKRVDAEHVVAQYKAIDQTACEMWELRERLTKLDPQEAPLEAEPNATMCDEYGGCPFRAKCNLSPDVINDSYAKHYAPVILNPLPKELSLVSTNSLFDRLKQKAANADQAGAATPTAAPPATATSTATTMPAASTPEAIAQAQTTLPPPPAVPAPETLGINPPEADLPPADPVGQAAAKKGRPKRTAAAKSEVVDKPAEAAPADVNEPSVMAFGALLDDYSTIELEWEHGGVKYSVRSHPQANERIGDAIRRVDAQVHGFRVELRGRPGKEAA